MSEEPVYAVANAYHPVGASDPVDAPEQLARGATLSARVRQRWSAWFRRAAGARAAAPLFDGTAGVLLDSLSDWICGLDATGRITYANAALMRDQGCVPGSLTGMLFVDLMPPAAVDAVRLALQRATTTDGPQSCQHETQVAGGGSWRQWTFQRIPENAPAELSGTYLLATGRDVTEQKRLEHQFLHAQRVGSIGMLASGIAHDLNNVLAPISMSADLLKLRGCSEENRALLDVVATSAARGAGLVNQMLSFTRGLDGNREIVNLGSLVKELSRFISRTFAKNIEVRMEIAPDLWRLHANPTQIYQVLLNLCVNARDAMPHGGEITITAENLALDEAAAAALPGAAPGAYAVLGVADTGTGIPPEIVNRIFDPFFTTKPIGEGTGLGLSTVRSIMKACGGFVTLSTQVGQGTTFRAHFPVMEPVTQPTTATNPGLPVARGAGEHVLVVDDEEFFRDVTRRLLEDFGYVVHVAADGAEAVRVFEQHRADIVVALVDFDMPVMDGPTAIKAMKTISPRLHIITVSGSGSSAAHPQPPEAELQLTKPYPMGELLQSLRRVLAQPAAV
ncbi:MAG TPA: ATP-binding protein [Opitutaceae bacterium]|nr:ATP-binding protein [Opitutaceae bacterium]